MYVSLFDMKKVLFFHHIYNLNPHVIIIENRLVPHVRGHHVRGKHKSTDKTINNGRDEINLLGL